MRKGFSLIEFLVVLAIIVLAASLIIVPLYQSRVRQALAIAADDVLVLVEDARNLTLAAKDDSTWGVHFQSDQTTLFKGPSYPGSDQKTVEFDERVEISIISLVGGGSEVIFQRLSGSTDQFGSVTLSLKNDPTQTRVISILASGLAELED